jgi:hypothetical protein
MKVQFVLARIFWRIEKVFGFVSDFFCALGDWFEDRATCEDPAPFRWCWRGARER